MHHRFALAALAMLAATPAAAVTNIVVNNGFETGNFNGWTRIGATSNEASRVVRPAAFAGTWGGRFSANTVLSGISQALATGAGREYAVSFVFRHGVGTAAMPSYAFRATFANAGPSDLLIDFRNALPTYEFAEWTHFSTRVVAVAASTDLSFEFSDSRPTAWFT
ncbi:MAG: hypothetical protein ACRCUI_08465, partial [Polymorphobacter sp.]